MVRLFRSLWYGPSYGLSYGSYEWEVKVNLSWPIWSAFQGAIILIFLCRTHHFPLPYTDRNVASINDIISQFRSNTRTVQDRIQFPYGLWQRLLWPWKWVIWCRYVLVLSGIYRKNTQSDGLRKEKRLRLLWSHSNIIWQIQLKKPLSNI